MPRVVHASVACIPRGADANVARIPRGVHASVARLLHWGPHLFALDEGWLHATWTSFS